MRRGTHTSTRRLVVFVCFTIAPHFLACARDTCMQVLEVVKIENNLKDVKQQISDFVMKSSHLGLLIDPKSDISVSKVVQQLAWFCWSAALP